MQSQVDDNGFPNHVLNYPINSKTKIYISFILPLALQLLVYLVQISCDIGVVILYFRIEQYHFGLVTLLLMISPPFIAFWILCLSTNINQTEQKSKAKYMCKQLCHLFTFPFSMIYSYSYRLFWSIEALCQENNERQECLNKAIEGSSSEVYNFVKAYIQSAPQIILLLYYMMNETLFRDYELSHIQAMSLTFSIIDLTIVTMTYQRFESQKLAGRPYPWSSIEQHTQLKQSRLKSKEIESKIKIQKQSKTRDSGKTVSSFPENDVIYNNFLKRESERDDENRLSEDGYDEVDGNITDEQKLHEQNQTRNSISLLDKSPSIHAPRPPAPRTQTSVTSSQQSTTPVTVLHRLSTFKDMFLINTELYIKNNVPRPPSILIKHVQDHDTESKENFEPTNVDEVDFFLPFIHETVDGGVQQDDFAGKWVAFFGWLCFIIMRILALSTFCYFYTKPFFYVVSAHYLFNLLILLFASKFKEKVMRTIFYFFLAYVYIFVILEFKIKFKRIKLWYVCFFIIMVAENLSMTFAWYNLIEFESWWFDFLYECILYGGLLFSLSLIVYYCILKPREIIIYKEVN